MSRERKARFSKRFFSVTKKGPSYSPLTPPTDRNPFVFFILWL